MNEPPAGWLTGRFAKTEAGRIEIQRRALPLSRAARNLLLVIDASRSGAAWLDMLQGCGRSDLVALVDAGLVQAQGGAGAAPGPAPSAGSGTPRMSLAQALETKGYQVLYDRITAEARSRLGLLKGYKLILDVERCQGPAEIRALAQRFVEQVRAQDGDAAALALAQTLLKPDA